MALLKSCKFYENSRCILGGKYCDLNCDQIFRDGDFQFYDQIDTLGQWRLEEVTRERDIGSPGWKLR
jgi:hypothetical protein